MSDDPRAEALLESLDRHFAAGCPSLSASQLREHEATGTCPECRRRAAAMIDAARGAFDSAPGHG